MAGMISFAFSTGLITLFGEIIPQAYFSRNALRMASLLAPILRFYQLVLYPVARPTSLLLDYWLGKEAVQFFAEKNIKLFIKKHIEDSESEIDHIEGTGAINFFSLDDLMAIQEGEEINPESIISLETKNNKIVFPEFNANQDNAFIQKINKSGEKWVILTNEDNEPLLALDSDGFIRSELFCHHCEGIEKYCHIPLIVKHENINLGEVIKGLKHEIDSSSDKPIEKDIVLVWLPGSKRIITGADIFGRILKGI